VTEPKQSVVAVEASEVERRVDESGADYEVNLESLSQWQLAWRKFKKHRLALIGLGLLTFLVVEPIGGRIRTPSK
jgi:hypothetical protein